MKLVYIYEINFRCDSRVHVSFFFFTLKIIPVEISDDAVIILWCRFFSRMHFSENDRGISFYETLERSSHKTFVRTMTFKNHATVEEALFVWR